MNIDNQYKRAVLYFLISSGESAISAAIKINSVHGEDTISVRTAQKWFKKFKVGESSIYDKPRSGHPVNFDNDVLKNLVESEPQLINSGSDCRKDGFIPWNSFSSFKGDWKSIQAWKVGTA